LHTQSIARQALTYYLFFAQHLKAYSIIFRKEHFTPLILTVRKYITHLYQKNKKYACDMNKNITSVLLLKDNAAIMQVIC